MEKYTYLLVLFFTIIICFVASFDKRLQFHKNFWAYLKAGIIVSIPFILWDIYFTQQGVWWFDMRYTLGISLFGLPIEEWLFFICIPFSCIFTYYCLDLFFKWEYLSAFNNILVFISITICGILALMHSDKIYTLVTVLLTMSTLIYLHFVVKAEWITQASLVFSILMLGFFPVNGVLTGTGLPSPIVNYNPPDFMGLRMLTIPVEDAIYGYSQFVWILYFFKKFQTFKMENHEA